MTSFGRFVAVALSGLALVSAAHLWLNTDWSVLSNERQPRARKKFNVAYIPVT